MNASGSALKVLRPLGTDAVSRSFLAAVPGMEGPRVVRVLAPELAADPVCAERFLAEANRLLDLDHPALLKVWGAGRMADGKVYAVTDFVEGAALGQGASAHLTLEVLVEAGVHLAQALAALHAAGALHGALDARHVLLAADGPRLDCTFASVERRVAATVEGDTRALVRLLLDAAAVERGSAPFEPRVRATLEAARTPAALAQALEAMRTHWKASTAVSLGGARPAVVQEETREEPDLTGRTLGNYELLGVVGEGAMGKVYRGRHTRIGRTAAVKVLKAEHASRRDLVDRFIQEAQAVNAIKNPHIVDIYDFGEEAAEGGQRRVFCVMELLEGDSLASLMEREALTVQLVTKVCSELAQALGAAHQVGVVHRDIKPDNVFLARKEKDAHYVKVLDFGVAKLLKPLGDIPKSGTQAGVVIGTPDYMAPEQALGQATDARADLYAVGLLLYEVLAGRRPYQGETFGQLVVEITTSPLPPLPPTTPRGEPIPAGLRTVVARCLEKKAEDRYQSAEQLAGALEAFAEGRPVFEGAVTAVSSAHEELASVRRSRAPVLVAVSAVLGLAAVGAYLGLAPSEPRLEAPVARVETPPEPPKAVVLSLESTPPGATVTRLDSHEVLGATPLKVELPRADDNLSLRFELQGRQAIEREVALGANAAMMVDLPAAPVVAPPVEPKKPGRPKKVSRDGNVDPFSR